MDATPDKQQPAAYERLDYWTGEFAEARKRLEQWHNQAREVDKVLATSSRGDEGGRRLEVFGSNLQTREAILYGRVPKCSIERRFADHDDDVSRIAGEILERLVNTDIERRDDTYCEALNETMRDRNRAGYGLARARYVVDTRTEQGKPAKYGDDGQELAPEVPEREVISKQAIDTDYVHWSDQLWSPCRNHSDMRWWAQCRQLDREELVKRWGRDGELAPLEGKDPTKTDGHPLEQTEHEWSRAKVWEVWDKDHGKVLFLIEGYKVLECKPDPYELPGFWPFPKALAYIPTTEKYVPRPDYEAARDLYRELNILQTRIDALTRMLKVVGIYDSGSGVDVELMMTLADGKLAPASRWAAFAEKGGFNGVVEWFPIEPVANVLVVLKEQRREVLALIDQVEGTADIMRGQASTANEAATTQAIKANYGSVRMDDAQKKFAAFASELQQIRAHLSVKFLEPETIKQRAGMQRHPDAAKVDEAIALLKSDLAQYRIEVKPENVNLTDFAALKSERLEVLQSISGYMQMAGGLVQVLGPSSLPFILEMLQVTLAGLKGASAFEGLIDQAIAEFKQAQQQAAMNPQQPPPDPKLQAEQVKAQVAMGKAQSDIQKEQLKHQHKLVEIQAETQARAMEEQIQRENNVQEAAQKQMVTNALKPSEPSSTGVPKR